MINFQANIHFAFSTIKIMRLIVLFIDLMTLNKKLINILREFRSTHRASNSYFISTLIHDIIELLSLC